MGNKLISCLDLIRKLRAFLAKQVSQDFIHSFLGLIASGNCLFLLRAVPPSGIVSGLSQAGEVRQSRDEETSCRQNEDSGYVKAEDKGPSPPFSIAPKSFPVGLFMTMPVLGRPSLEESYPSLANWSGSGPSRVK